jgi:hypothetical protein
LVLVLSVGDFVVLLVLESVALGELPMLDKIPVEDEEFGERVAEVVTLVLSEALGPELEGSVVLLAEENWIEELLDVKLEATVEADTEEESIEVDELEESEVSVVIGAEEGSVVGVDDDDELPVVSSCSGMV